jgi:hypothetical protein
MLQESIKFIYIMNSRLCFLFILCCLSSVNLTFGANYYVNSNIGSDAYNGLSEQKPWKSLTNINNKIFSAGDKILFAAGTTYEGQLKPRGLGTEALPIKIDRYGEGVKPAIHGKGLFESTLLLYNVRYWEVRNLEITNLGETSKANRRGVIVRAQNFGDCNHIILEGLEIHNVNGVLVKADGGGSGIYFHIINNNVKTRFVNLQVLNNYIHHCERNAINFGGNSSRTNWNPSIGVVIRGNLIENVPGDGIVPIGCDGALIEYNVIRKGIDSLPTGDAAAGIWPWSSDNTLIQYNEVSDHRAKWDGQAYDADFNCIGSVFQYNLSFNNWGGFMLICNNGSTLGTHMNIGTKNTIVKYNLSINDGLRPYKAQNNRYFSPVFHITGPVENTNIENNIIIIPKKPVDQIEKVLLEFGNWGEKYPNLTSFKKNIVRYQTVFTNNNISNTTGYTEGENDSKNVFDFTNTDPLFVLNQLTNHSLVKNDANYTNLYHFIKNRNNVNTAVQDIPEHTFSVCPNPFNNSVSINNASELKSISFINLIGQVVLSEENPANNILFQIDTSSLDKGAYLLRLLGKGEYDAVKLIKN